MEVFAQNDQDYCRLCSEARPVFFSLLENQTTEMIEALAPTIKPNYNQGSSLICTLCLVEVRNAYKLQQKLIESEKRLNEISTSLGTSSPEMVWDNQYTTKTENVDQLLVNSKESDSPCLVEPSEFSLKTILKNVNKEFDGIEVEYKCAKCPQICHLAAEYVTHLDTHRTHFCKICRMDVPQDELQKHNKSHDSGYCNYCGVTVKNKDSLRQHIKRIHMDAKIVCEICGVISVTKENHDVHMRDLHTGSASHVCKICGEKFFSLNGITRHTKSKHSKGKPFKCEVCNKTFSLKIRFKMHQRIHSDERLYVCEFCGRGFKLKCNLKSHKKSIHNFVDECNFKCIICGKDFGSALALSVHWRIHSKQIN